MNLTLVNEKDILTSQIHDLKQEYQQEIQSYQDQIASLSNEIESLKNFKKKNPSKKIKTLRGNAFINLSIMDKAFMSVINVGKS